MDYSVLFFVGERGLDLPVIDVATDNEVIILPKSLSKEGWTDFFLSNHAKKNAGHHRLWKNKNAIWVKPGACLGGVKAKFSCPLDRGLNPRREDHDGNEHTIYKLVRDDRLDAACPRKFDLDLLLWSALEFLVHLCNKSTPSIYDVFSSFLLSLFR